jgi:opacity protein-like surface antigen
MLLVLCPHGMTLEVVFAAQPVDDGPIFWLFLGHAVCPTLSASTDGGLMRKCPLAVVVLGLLYTSSSVSAQERGFVQGFGGLQLERQSTVDTSLGGAVAGSLTPNLQFVGEAGRVSNVLPGVVDSLLDISPVGFGVSALYATGGLRFTTSGSAVRPYLETTAGFARLQGDLRGTGSGVIDTIGDIALGFFSRTDPVAGVGGGVTLGGGNVMADVGYRFKRIFSSGWVHALALDDRLQTSEVRVGVGIRF